MVTISTPNRPYFSIILLQITHNISLVKLSFWKGFIPKVNIYRGILYILSPAMVNNIILKSTYANWGVFRSTLRMPVWNYWQFTQSGLPNSFASSIYSTLLILYAFRGFTLYSDVKPFAACFKTDSRAIQSAIHASAPHLESDEPRNQPNVWHRHFRHASRYDTMTRQFFEPQLLCYERVGLEIRFCCVISASTCYF